MTTPFATSTSDDSAARMSPSRSPWVGLHRPARDRVRARLMVVPFAGGNASAFFPWISQIGGDDWLEVAVVQPPGRGARFREPAVESLESYAEAIAAEARALAGSHGPAPLFLMGYSMGALVAYLTARDHAPGLRLTRLIVAARPAPVARPSAPAAARMSRDQVLARLARLQGTPEALLHNPELLEPYLEAISAEFQLVDGWPGRHLPKIDVDVTAFAGLDDPETPVAEVFPWAGLTTRSFAAFFLPGGHFFLHTARPMFCRMVRQLTEATIEGEAR